jgi:pimeloyl-ACP methyl ester carboxylesterase
MLMISGPRRSAHSWLLSSLVLVGACGDDSAPTVDAGSVDASLDSTTDAVSLDASTPRFEIGACPVAFPGLVEGETVRCGKLVVLQDRARPDGLVLRLSVVIVHADDDPEPDPIVHLLGGPGLSVRAYQEVLSDFALSLSAASGRDVVFFDQRGTGDSEPFLACRAAEAFDACSARLASEGIELAYFDTASSADDVDDLRRALGAPSLHVYGQSYGTTLALEVMRRHPTTTASALLESTSSPAFDVFLTSSPRSFELAFARVVEECAADVACAEEFPDPSADLAGILGGLTPGSDEADGFVGLVRSLMQSAQGSSLVPLLLASVVQGDTETLSAIVETAREAAAEEERVFRRFSEVMYWSMTCGDYAPRATDEENERVNGEAHPVLRAAFGEDPAAFRALCGTLPRREVDLAPVRSDIPTLIFAGTHDDNTPLEIAESVAAELGSARVLRAPGWGHVMLARGNACLRDAYARFIEDPASAVPPCVAEQRVVFPTSLD